MTCCHPQVPHEELLVIKNTSETIAHWHFVPKLEDVAVSKSWIAFDKTSGLLLPFEVRFACTPISYFDGRRLC